MLEEKTALPRPLPQAQAKLKIDTISHYNPYMPKFLAIFLLLIFCQTAVALTPEQHLANQQDEARAMNLFTQIRCLVCEAQSIESSNTEFSLALRKVIRQKIEQGKNNEEIKKDLKKEFGEQIFMTTQNEQQFIWLAPLIFALLLGVTLLFIYHKKNATN